jgi:hypothetical protein
MPTASRPQHQRRLAYRASLFSPGATSRSLPRAAVLSSPLAAVAVNPSSPLAAVAVQPASPREAVAVMSQLSCRERVRRHRMPALHQMSRSVWRFRPRLCCSSAWPRGPPLINTVARAAGMPIKPCAPCAPDTFWSPGYSGDLTLKIFSRRQNPFFTPVDTKCSARTPIRSYADSPTMLQVR